MAKPHIATIFQHPVDPIFSYYDSGTKADEWNGFGEYNSDIPAYHLGDDYFVGQVEVGAIANGYAIESGYNSGFGNYVVIRHELPDGKVIYSLYAHMENVDSAIGIIPKGSGIEVKVDIGQTLGIAGNEPDGAQHLHLEISDYGDLFTIQASGIDYARGYDGAVSPAFSSSVPIGNSPDGDPVLGVGKGIYDPSDFIDDNNTTAKVTQNYTPKGPTMAPGDVNIPAPSGNGPATGMTDPGFEDGNLPDWQTVGVVTTETSYDIDGANNSTDIPATAIEGDSFATLVTGTATSVSEIEDFLDLAAGSIQTKTGNDPTVGSAIKTEIEIGGNLDSFFFDFYFDSGDYDPFNDFAILVVDGEIIPLSDVYTIGDFGDTGWTNTGVTDLDKGTHEIGIAVFDARDDLYTSALYVDDFQFV